MKHSKKGTPWSVYKRLISEVIRHWRYLVIILVAMLCFSVANLAMVYMVGPVLSALFNPDEATITAQIRKTSMGNDIKSRIELFLAPIIWRETPIRTLSNFCFLLLIVVIAKNLFHYLQNIFTAQMLHTITTEIRNKMFSKILDMPLGFFHKHKSGELISRVLGDVLVMQDSISLSVAEITRDPLQILIYCGFLVILDWRLTLMLTIVAPILGILMTIIGKNIRKYSSRSQKSLAGLSAVLHEAISGIRIIKAFLGERHERNKFESESKRYLKTQVKMTRVQKLTTPVNETIGVIVAVALLWFGGRNILLAQHISAPQFFQYVITLMLLLQPVKSFSDKVNRIQQGIAAGQRVFELLDLHSEPEIWARGKKIIQSPKKVVFENVWFKYDNSNDWAVSDFHLEINAGNVVALVGPSGAGKSTIADLLAKYYIPTKGRIIIDDTDITEIDTMSWRKMLGVVTQDVILFNDSVAENIAYGDTNPDIDRIKASARNANALDFIEKLPQKFETPLGERGVRLSGGERQRIAIARAIHRNPPILILDEATSALDSESEKLVQNALENLMAGRTVIVIAHRLSTVLRADKIVVLDKGKKICEGTHSELLEKCQIYRKVYEIQFAGRIEGEEVINAT